MNFSVGMTVWYPSRHLNSGKAAAEAKYIKTDILYFCDESMNKVRVFLLFPRLHIWGLRTACCALAAQGCPQWSTQGIVRHAG